MKKSLLSLLYRLGFTHVLRHLKYRSKLITILCLHRISDEDSVTFFPFKIKDFELLLQYLQKHYQVVTIETLKHLNGNKPAIVLSFDDGFLDFYQNGLPLLNKYQMPCNLNVITRCLDNNYQIWTQRQNNIIDEIYKRKHKFSFVLDDKKIEIDDFSRDDILKKTNAIFSFLIKKNEEYVDKFLSAVEDMLPFTIPLTPMMTWDDLNNALDNYDIELGSHTMTHVTLANINDPKRLQQEIRDSKEIIENRTRRKVNVIAFPNGSYNTKIIEECINSGYQHALTVDEELIALNAKNDFKLPRLLIAYENYFENMLKIEDFHNGIKNIVNRIRR